MTPGSPPSQRHHAQQPSRRPADAAGSLRPEQLTEPFAPSQSPVAVFEEASEVDRVNANTAATDLGRWAHEVDTLIRTAFATDRPADAAFGWTGEATVQFQVSRTGKVVDVTVVQSSGEASFDALARLAVPSQLPRPPDGPVRRRITFKQR